MSAVRELVTARPAEALFVLLDTSSDEAERRRFAAWLASALPSLSWRAHLFLLAESATEPGPLLGVPATHLEQHGFAVLTIHPSVHLGLSDDLPSELWERQLATANPWQHEAYLHQGEARLITLPIVEAAPGVPAERVQNALDFFRSRLARPSLLVRGAPPEEILATAPRDELRIYIDPDEGASGLAGTARQLWINHVFESALERTEADADPLLPCRPHRVVDERTGTVFACFKCWEETSPAASTGESLELAGRGLPGEDVCATCVARAILAMGQNLAANDRRAEGQRLSLKAAMACAARQSHGLAAELAGAAYAFAGDGAERAAALLHKALSHLSLAELQQADDALKLMAEHTTDQGLVAFHRGRVQFAWRDWIEALERFQQALELGSPEVSPTELHFQMALCHINLEEYADARPHLDAATAPERRAAVSFYHGLCELGEGRVVEALARLDEAVEAGPAPEDLGRVLFYRATCHKEAGRFDDAIAELRRAIEADPEDLANHNLLGFCYYKTGRHDEAVRCFRRAVELDPRSAIDWANLGSNLRDLGRTDEAVAMYRKALSLDPSIGFAQAGLRRLTARD